MADMLFDMFASLSFYSLKEINALLLLVCHFLFQRGNGRFTSDPFWPPLLAILHRSHDDSRTLSDPEKRPK